MNKTTFLDITAKTFAGLCSISFIIVIFFIFRHSHHLAEFDEARRHLHNVSYNTFKNQQKEAYAIVQHFSIEYFISSITKDGREIPEGNLVTISLDEEYVFGPYSSGTSFIYDFLKKIVNNEATLFNAQFGHIPTEVEMKILLDEMPYYNYLVSLQSALFDVEHISDISSNLRYLSGYDKKTLNQLWAKLESNETRMTKLLAQNPSKLKITSIDIVN